MPRRERAAAAKGQKHEAEPSRSTGRALRANYPSSRVAGQKAGDNAPT